MNKKQLIIYLQTFHRSYKNKSRVDIKLNNTVVCDVIVNKHEEPT